jgi:hypothetical protein
MLHYYACGLAGMNESDFWASEVWVVINRINAYHEKESTWWQKISWLGSLIISPYTKKGQKSSPDKLAPWAWDDGKETGPLSPEERKKIFAEADARAKRAHERRQKLKNGKT